MERGLIHVYHGDGKGKTTCAFGLALRCAGCGYPVRIVQFLKGGETGEVNAIAQLSGVQLLRAATGTKFTFRMNEAERRQAQRDNTALLEQAFSKAGNLRLLVLDEALIACGTGMVDEARLRQLLIQRPPQLEVVLTGRNPPQWLLDMADYVTHMRKQKHPYDRGVRARRGVEW